MSCLSRPMEAIDWRKNLLLNKILTTPWTHTEKVVKGDEMVSHFP